jgi:hypothetical protein
MCLCVIALELVATSNHESKHKSLSLDCTATYNPTKLLMAPHCVGRVPVIAVLSSELE